jgi:hypothetical protein
MLLLCCLFFSPSLSLCECECECVCLSVCVWLCVVWWLSTMHGVLSIVVNYTRIFNRNEPASIFGYSQVASNRSDRLALLLVDELLHSQDDIHLLLVEFHLQRGRRLELQCIIDRIQVKPERC